jgi:hypothetical protein
MHTVRGPRLMRKFWTPCAGQCSKRANLVGAHARAYEDHQFVDRHPVDRELRPG